MYCIRGIIEGLPDGPYFLHDDGRAWKKQNHALDHLDHFQIPGDAHP